MNKKALFILILFFLAPASCSDTDKRLQETTVDRAATSRPAGQQISPSVTEADANDRAVPAVTSGEKTSKREREKHGSADQAGARSYHTSPLALRPEAQHVTSEIQAQPGGYLPPPLPQPGRWNRESYDAVDENRFINVLNDPLSTFSIDVDTASYANVRRLINGGVLPPRGAVRVEEMINYFSYSLPEPTGSKPFTLEAEVGPSPFNAGYKLAKIGLKARDIDEQQLPPSNLVFLIDVSGSMNQPRKLPLVKQSLNMLAAELTGQDRVAIVVYAGSDRIVLEPTPGSEKDVISQAVQQLRGGGSTHASSGIVTAYELAVRSFIPGGNNRVILVSDGDFNVGITSRSELQSLVEEKRQSGVYLTVLGFGSGNYHDDTMEILADKGNGNYAYIDSLLEAKKVLIKERSGTLFALANDVKIQVEFNPAQVGAYRLIGYENRALADEDFRDDSKDAGEIGAGHRVTALYEIIPQGAANIPPVDALKYQPADDLSRSSNNELLTVKLRFKPAASKTSVQIATSIKDNDITLDQTSTDFRFAASVAGFGMLLKHSEHRGVFGWDDCLSLARNARGDDKNGYRAEFTRLVEMAQLLQKQSS
jgi:Ca-activated chloride channel family protein